MPSKNRIATLRQNIRLLQIASDVVRLVAETNEAPDCDIRFIVLKLERAETALRAAVKELAK